MGGHSGSFLRIGWPVRGPEFDLGDPVRKSLPRPIGRKATANPWDRTHKSHHSPVERDIHLGSAR